MAGGCATPIVFTPEHERAAAAVGVKVFGCLDTVLAHAELRERARRELCGE